MFSERNPVTFICRHLRTEWELFRLAKESGLACVLQHLTVLLNFVLFQDYKQEEDPSLFHSAKTGRGPLGPEWKVPKLNTELH